MLKADEKVQIQIGKCQHYKGGMYEVLDLARHSESLEELVIYRSLSTGELWARPKAMFYGKVVVDGKEASRFEFIE